MGENIKNWQNEELTKSVLLTLTNQCNLNCSYCYEKNKNKEQMSFATAKQIIDYELSLNDGFPFVSFDFFGGEPLLQFPLIKQLVEYIKTIQTGKKIICFIMTNGTLVHEEIKEWLLANRDHVVCGLSLDGKKESHDLNRSNSFDKIDIDFFCKTYPKQDIKMTISEVSLPFLFENVKFCHEKGFFVSCNLAYGINWMAKSNQAILERELKKLIDYYLDHPQTTPASILDGDIFNVVLEAEKTSCKKWCGVGTSMKTYAVNGDLYPCQLFMPISADSEIDSRSIVFEKSFPISYLDDECQKCIIRPVCPTCYGSNYIATGNIYKRDMSMCELNKIIIRARAYFKAMQWEKGLLTLTPQEEKLLINSILKIQSV